MKNIKTYLFFLIAVLYFLPAFSQFDFDEDNRIQAFKLALPRVLSGDVPHNLLVVHSLILDKDFDVKNNFENVRDNDGREAGFNHRGKRSKELMPPYYDSQKRVYLEGAPENYKDSFIKCIYNRPPGLAVFTALFLWPLGFIIPKYWLIEPCCVLLSIIAMLIGLLYLYKTLLFYSKDEKKSIVVLLLFAFGTQLWHYAGQWQIESFIAPFLIISYYYFIIKEKNFIPGTLLAILLSMRFPIAVTILIFMLYRFQQRKYLQLIPFLLPSLFIGMMILYYHYKLYGNPFVIPQNYYFATGFGNPLTGILGSLFNFKWGLITFSPFLILSFLGIKPFHKRYPQHALFIFILMLLYFLIYTVRGINWEGGGYSSRYLVPLIPFLAIFFLFFYQNIKSKIALVATYFLLIPSVIINMQAAFLSVFFWGNHPLYLIQIIFAKFRRFKEVFFFKDAL